MGFAVTAMAFPLMLYAQLVRGMSPTESALLMAPMALMTLVLAPVVGRWTDSVHPRILTGTGFGVLLASIVWLIAMMAPDTSVWMLVAPLTFFGIGNAFVWAPNSATATRNLRMDQAGAGAGVYNATRQVASVLGSAGVAVLMDSRLAANGLVFEPSEGSTGASLPAQVLAPFSDAMAQAMLLVPAGLAVGLLGVMFFERPEFQRAAASDPAAPVAEPETAPG